MTYNSFLFYGRCWHRNAEREDDITL